MRADLRWHLRFSDADTNPLVVFSIKVMSKLDYNLNPLEKNENNNNNTPLTFEGGYIIIH
jgi:hypothetical protein